jgi:hypothetical protein
MIKLLKYYAIFLVIYIPLTILTIPFFVSWGSKKSFIEKGYLMFIGSPFDYSKSLWFIFVNSLFWFIILCVIVIGVNKLIRIINVNKTKLLSGLLYLLRIYFCCETCLDIYLAE